MQNVGFFEVMNQSNKRLNEKRMKGVSSQNFSDVIIGCIQLGVQTNNKEVLDNMILHAPTKGEVVDTIEDLSYVSSYIKSLEYENIKIK